ncbi:MAG TPA: resistance to Congo red protein [Thermoanaerobaculia bacterium]|nr:resistance to Congo red protein [Thermoanaerobaculia bacterium]
MATAEKKVAKRLEKREDVQFALEQAGGADEQTAPKAQLSRRDRSWIAVWGVVLAVLAVAYLCFRLRWLPSRRRRARWGCASHGGSRWWWGSSPPSASSRCC